MKNTIYTNEDGFSVIHGTDDADFPIGINDEYWLGASEAVEATDAILDALGHKPASTPTPQVEVDPSEALNVTLIRVAEAYERPITFRYAKGDGSNIELRTFIPSEVKSIKDHLTVWGYDPDRDEPRAYRVDRIKGRVQLL